MTETYRTILQIPFLVILGLIVWLTGAQVWPMIAAFFLGGFGLAFADAIEKRLSRKG